MVEDSQESRLRERRVGVAVFVAGCFVNLLLVCGGVLHSLGTLTESPLLWVVALPAMAVQRLRLLGSEWAIPVFLLNSVIYGGMVWFAWRMWKLMRRKPAE